jgi:hypothetical protein
VSGSATLSNVNFALEEEDDTNDDIIHMRTKTKFASEFIKMS